MTTEQTFEIENTDFEVGVLEPQDINDLILIASEWVRNRDTGEIAESELQTIRERMQSSLTSEEYKYYVIRNEDRKAIGCCAIREPEEAMQPYISGSNTLELVNVFLTNKYRGKGLGYRLMQFTFQKARELGFDEVIWNSGPRYKNSAWDFYTNLAGQPIDIASKLYGEGGDAPIWRKNL